MLSLCSFVFFLFLSFVCNIFKYQFLILNRFHFISFGCFFSFCHNSCYFLCIIRATNTNIFSMPLISFFFPFFFVVCLILKIRLFGKFVSFDFIDVMPFLFFQRKRNTLSLYFLYSICYSLFAIQSDMVHGIHSISIRAHKKKKKKKRNVLFGIPQTANANKY